MKHTLRLVTAALAAVLLALPARANLLTPANESQLEAWLGQGNLDFTNIFTKVQGDSQDNSMYFHSAADNKGATFVLLSVFGTWHDESPTNLPPQVIGGYNPQSWDASKNGFTETPNLADRTAFIFNLTNSTIQRQKLDVNGMWQTFNEAGRGPTFGSGWDITVEGALFYGSASNYSYGGSNGSPITFGGEDDLTYYDGFRIDRLEVYTFARVPDATNTLGLLALALAGLAVLHCRACRAGVPVRA
jgi:hypothetical protein